MVKEKPDKWSRGFNLVSPNGNEFPTPGGRANLSVGFNRLSIVSEGVLTQWH
jgi:hypothetical protein